MSLKPKYILSGLTALWVLVAVFEGAASLGRIWSGRKMGAAARAASGLVHYVRGAILVVLAVSNVVLFMRHVDDR